MNKYLLIVISLLWSHELENILQNISNFFSPDFAEDITADADDHLLHEVEQELRGTLLQNRSKPAERSCQTESKSSILGVVPEEKDIEHLASKVEELEATVDQLTICIGKKLKVKIIIATVRDRVLPHDFIILLFLYR